MKSSDKALSSRKEKKEVSRVLSATDIKRKKKGLIFILKTGSYAGKLYLKSFEKVSADPTLQ